jgi:FkbM family methyltransferase
MSLAEFIYTEVLKPKPLKALANAVLLRLIPDRVHIGDMVLRLDRGDPVVSGALALGVFEPSEVAFFRRYCQGAMTMVDIGANTGLYTALALHQLDAAGRIVAVEPHPATFELLRGNIAANQVRSQDIASASRAGSPAVVALNLAASDADAICDLRLNPENRGDNRLYRGTYQGRTESWQTIPVPARPLDDVLAELDIHEVHFVKIDVQGYEERAIGGLRQTLARCDRVILLSEFWPKGLQEAGGGATSYLQLLTDLGFALYELKERPRGRAVPLADCDQLVARLPGRKYTNIIAVKGYTL